VCRRKPTTWQNLKKTRFIRSYGICRKSASDATSSGHSECPEKCCKPLIMNAVIFIPGHTNKVERDYSSLLISAAHGQPPRGNASFGRHAQGVGQRRSSRQKGFERGPGMNTPGRRLALCALCRHLDCPSWTDIKIRSHHKFAFSDKRAGRTSAARSAGVGDGRSGRDEDPHCRGTGIHQLRRRFQVAAGGSPGKVSSADSHVPSS
jgi:hypothetical protein